MARSEEELEGERILAESFAQPKARHHPSVQDDGHDEVCEAGGTTRAKASSQTVNVGAYVQWMDLPNGMYAPAAKTVDRMAAGVYSIHSNPNIGIYFQNIPVHLDGLLLFPQANAEKVIREIERFWEQEHRFRQFQMPYKRGLFLFGPPGGGKTSAIKFVCKDVIERGGVVIQFKSPNLFTEGMHAFRQVQPETPVIILMEDIDSMIRDYSETEVLNILDGVQAVHKMVFLATSNYPELLGERIINRPSRFDKRFYIGFPNAESRYMYFEWLRGAHHLPEMDIPQWVKDTDRFSLAHLKELFVAVMIIGDDYDAALSALKSMSKQIEGNGHKGRASVLSGSNGHETDW